MYFQECTCCPVKLFIDDGVNLQSVNAYLRRGTACEFVGNYKGANEGQKHFPPAHVFPCICCIKRA